MQDTGWARGLELVADDERLVTHAGVLPLRLLAERTGLTGRLPAAMARRGFDPVFDQRQILVDLALVLILGGEAISDFQALRHLTPVIGSVPSTSTVWRALEETGEVQLARVNAAGVEFRGYWWGRLADRPQGFPWLSVAGRELTGVTVLDLDATVVFTGSEKENAKATYKGGTGLVPNLATCDNTGDVLAIDPRGLREQAMNCRFSVGWAITARERAAITTIPERIWAATINAEGGLRDGAGLAEITGLLPAAALTGYPARHPGHRPPRTPPTPARNCPLFEESDGWRYTAFATHTPVGQLAFLDARHRAHARARAGSAAAKTRPPAGPRS
ncbi:MAG: hypothetical protein QOH57_3749 [Mycobacterium sp.]|nr:hypothetical protein [Mycobacterium sp.]